MAILSMDCQMPFLMTHAHNCGHSFALLFLWCSCLSTSSWFLCSSEPLWVPAWPSLTPTSLPLIVGNLLPIALIFKFLYFCFYSCVELIRFLWGRGVNSFALLTRSTVLELWMPWCSWMLSKKPRIQRTVICKWRTDYLSECQGRKINSMKFVLPSLFFV